MTFQDALTIQDAKIELLGGLAAVYEFLPETIKEDRHNTVEDSEWYPAAGYKINNHDEITPCDDRGLRLHCKRHNITDTTAAELITILKRTADRITEMSQADYENFIERISKGRNYAVRLSVYGCIETNVVARSFEDASEKARELAANNKIQFSNLEYPTIDTLVITDDNGISVNF